MVVAVAQQAAISPSDTPLEHEDTYVQQLWHSLEEALHLREPVPPPVPPKDERWMVNTVDLSISPQDEEDVHFWDKLTSKLTSRYHHYILQQESVSIDVPTEAALNHLGNQGTEDELQQRRVYFKRMSRLCQQKFEHDNEIALKEQQEDESLVNATSEDVQEPHHHHRHHRILSSLKDRLHGRRHSTELVPKIDPEEMRAAHRLMYGHGNGSASSVSLDLGSKTTASESDDSWGRSMFGLWWGHRRHSDSETNDTLGEDDWEKVDIPRHKADQRESLREQNGLVPAEPEPQSKSETHRHHHFRLGRRTPKTDASVLGSSLTVDQSKRNQKSTLQRHQALAAAAAYEAMKAYQAKKIRQGKKVSHGEMKAILAGMAMAEAVKLLESRHHSSSDTDDIDGDDDAVAEAGSKVLKLFELWRSP